MLMCKTVLVLCLQCAALLASDAQKFLDAPVVEGHLSVGLSSDGKALDRYDDKLVPRRLHDGDLFLVRDSIRISYYKLNPLRVEATTSVTSAADPSFDAVKKLLTALTGIAGQVLPVPAAGTSAAGGAPPPPPPPPDKADKCADARNKVNTAYNNLFGSSAPKLAPASWVSAIDAGFDQGGGPAAMRAGQAAIREELKGINTTVTNTERVLGEISECSASIPELRSFEVVARQRMGALKQYADAASRLADSLSAFAQGNWLGPNHFSFVIGEEVNPDRQTLRNVTIKVTQRTLSVNPDSFSLLVTPGTPVSVQVTARKYARFVAEPGAGAVISTLRAPEYATETRDGAQHVKRTNGSGVSVAPTVLVNWVCRCDWGLFSPVFQIGAATSTTAPSVLVGVGFRLFGLGSGDVAIGGGPVFGWVKDLQKLREGDIVTGEAAIKADLGFRAKPQIGGYFVIQYKF